MEVTPGGGRLWRFKYRIAGKEKRIALGIYPDVGLKDARERPDAARRQVAARIDPSEQRKAQKSRPRRRTRTRLRRSLESGSQCIQRSGRRATVTRLFVDSHSTSFPGSERVRSETLPLLNYWLCYTESDPEVLTKRRTERCRPAVGLRYAIATARAERDPSRDLMGTLAPVIERHHASITELWVTAARFSSLKSFHFHRLPDPSCSSTSTARSCHRGSRLNSPA